MRSNATTALVALAAACLFAGCRSATVSESVLPRLAANDPQTQLDYWHTVAARPLVSNDEAFHGLLLYLDGKDDSTTYAQRVASLQRRNMLPHGFNQSSDAALQRGTLAVPLVRALDLKVGVTVRLTGLSPRYATRELQYREIYPPSSSGQVFTGAEFVGVIGKAQDFRQGDPTNLPAAETSASATAQASEQPVTPILAMIQPPQVGDLTLSPATTQAAGPIKVIITAVDGLASVRSDENSPWKPAVKGMELNEQAEFRTGPRGSIQFVIPPGQTVSVDRLTTMKVLKLIRDGGKVTTDLGIKYGRTRYDLEGGGLEHQSTLRSPNATLAVRGTKVSLFDQPPFAPQATSLTGRAQFQAFRRQALAFGNRNQGKTIVNSRSDAAGDVGLARGVVDPALHGARPESDAPLVTTVLSRTIDQETSSDVKVVGGAPPSIIPASLLPGKLNFVLRWDGNANLDLAVSTPGTQRSPGGEFIYPISGFNLGPSGGRALWDHAGGPNGGIEIVSFDSFEDGIYAVAGPDLTAGSVVNATLSAFLDGQPINLFDGLELKTQVTQVVSSVNPALALVPVNTPFQVPTFKKTSGVMSLKAAALSAPEMGPYPSGFKPAIKR